jgi:hypothetical protein
MRQYIERKRNLRERNTGIALNLTVGLRGILQNEYKVAPQELEWLVAEPDIAGSRCMRRHQKFAYGLFLRRARENTPLNWWSRGNRCRSRTLSALASNLRLRYIVGDYRKASRDVFLRPALLR